MSPSAAEMYTITPIMLLKPERVKTYSAYKRSEETQKEQPTVSMKHLFDVTICGILSKDNWHDGDGMVNVKTSIKLTE